MICVNCKNEVKDNENFCPHCGSNLSSNTGNYNFTVSRPGKLMGAAVSLKVTVNGNPIKLGAGESFGYNLPMGPCSIKYKFWCRREKEIIINVQPNKIYSLIFKYDALWGGFKVSKDSVLD